jgi:hypothetical protein
METEYATLVNSVQEANDYAVYALTEAGYNGSALQASVMIQPTDSRIGKITERNSRERIELLSKANTHGQKFFATGGSHVCSDDFFKAQALIARKEEVAEKTKLKENLLAKAKIREKGMEIIVAKAAAFESNSYSSVTTKELDTLLQWYGIIDLKGMKKADKVARWKEIRASNTGPPEADVWTAADEENLAQLANQEIDMSETYLGRYAAMQKRNAVAAILDFTDEEWESLKTLKEADEASRSNTTEADAVANNTGLVLMNHETMGAESGAE